MSRLNWNKPKLENLTRYSKRDLNRRKLDFKFKANSENYSTYRDKNFYIGNQLIHRYNPIRGKPKNNTTLFNVITARMEHWRDGKLQSSINWKVGQAALKEWHLNNLGKQSIKHPDWDDYERKIRQD